MPATRVLIVDDSLFFRKRLTEILTSDKNLEVIGTATNGNEAIIFVKKYHPDVITMDIEMPVMDGITAVKEIMDICPTPILMFSSLTTSGAKSTLDALDAGAMDYLPKNLSEIASDSETAKRQLCSRVLAIGKRGITLVKKKSDVDHKKDLLKDQHHKLKKIGVINDYDLLLIGTSTGGPAAIQKILSGVPSDINLPIVIIQHMPESFTGPFANRLNNLCEINVNLCVNGEKIVKGNAYLAPGGHQLTLSTNSSGGITSSIKVANDSDTYKPCIDISFKSAASNLDMNILAIILTGMGSDGKEGVDELKRNGARIITQDEDSSVIYGMPMSVANAGLTDVELSLNDIANYITGN